ncbi:hypothetical protein PC9H_006848 [Pleurotus ostreatus]|uniref:Uncharacterized protein n=1 Tax=Pleurotus ostreatus TaxID=5322 RepID=A0A8H6ZXR0_PLEOS|nr:uncharacterized protein PC9H_006848 [Pleurotus ostreatus]KAF7431128.1 hypothetical protein PC9H_006848 [Pleurotus ostreatus]
MPPRKSLPKFHTSAQIQDVAKQYRSNRSNAEWMWYSPYVLTLESLLDVGHINNLIAPSRESLVPRPQGVVILSKEKLIQLDDIDDLSEDVLDIDPNSSFETTVSTTTEPADRKAIYGIPDCSIAHTASKPAVDGKFQVYHTCLPGLVENKKAPSRRPSGGGLTREKLLESAQAQLLYYDAIYFAEHPTFTKIVNIPAAGPYWTWALIQKAQVPSFDFMKLFMTASNDLYEDVHEKDWALYMAVAETVATNPIHILGTAEC